MDNLTEVITSTACHPTHCNLYAYSTSQGITTMSDLRVSARGTPCRSRNVRISFCESRSQSRFRRCRSPINHFLSQIHSYDSKKRMMDSWRPFLPHTRLSHCEGVGYLYGTRTRSNTSHS